MFSEFQSIDLNTDIISELVGATDNVEDNLQALMFVTKSNPSGGARNINRILNLKPGNSRRCSQLTSIARNAKVFRDPSLVTFI